MQSDTPCLRQLINQYEETHSSVIGVQTVPNNETHRYGIVKPSVQINRRYQVENFVEKHAAPRTAPSNLAIMGRYVLIPEIFMYLEQQEAGAGEEIQLTDAIQKLNQIQRVFAYDFEGRRYDVGEKSGFVKTTIEFALQDLTPKKELLKFMGQIMEGEKVKY